MKGDSLRSLLGKDRRVLVLTALLIVGSLVAAVLGWLYWQAQRQDENLNDKTETLIENIGQLRLLDETLTMSAVHGEETGVIEGDPSSLAA